MARTEDAAVNPVIAGRDQVLRGAKELAVPTEGRDIKDIKLEIAKTIDREDATKVVTVAKVFGLPVEGVSSQTLKEQIIRRLQI